MQAVTSNSHDPTPSELPAPAQGAAPAESTSIHDEVNISDAARWIEQARQTPDVRQDRVQSLRAQIAAGTYETPDKLDVTVNRLLDEIG